jgi:hypothetical protein
MPEPNPEPNPEQLVKIYEAICDSYHKVDDFRATVLGLLPVASGTAIFMLMDKNKEGAITGHLTEIGFFGALVTLGLLTYELKGIQKCTGLICYGLEIERFLSKGTPAFNGQFDVLIADRTSNWFASEPVASAIVYSTVLAAWAYIGLANLSCNLSEWAAGLFAFVIWLLSVTWVLVFWKRLANPVGYSKKVISLPVNETQTT